MLVSRSRENAIRGTTHTFLSFALVYELFELLMPLVNVLIKAELVAHVHKTKLASFFASVEGISYFRDSYVLTLPPRNFIGFLAHSVCTGAHIRGHSLLKIFNVLESLSARKARWANRSAN